MVARALSGAARLSEPAGGAACAADITISPSFVDFSAAEVREDVVERRIRTDMLLQVIRRSFSRDATRMHDGEPIAQLACLLHVVRGEKHRHVVACARLEQALPHRVARHWIE